MKARILLFLAFLKLSYCLQPLTTGWESREFIQDDYEVVSYPSDTGSPRLVTYIVSSTVPSTGRKYTMYVGLLRNGLPNAFTVELPTGGCCHRSKTSVTAKQHNCSYATNAGFFNIKDGCCVGNLISNGKTIQVSTLSRVNFGLLNNSYAIGYMSEDVIKSKGFLQFVTGAGWLVRKGQSYINESKVTESLSKVFVSEKAPRTAVGVASNGSVYLLEVDGEEDTKSGLDLYEFAEVIAKLGLSEVANLDGGGSSVSVKDGKVIDKPTCFDTSLICERALNRMSSPTANLRKVKKSPLPGNRNVPFRHAQDLSESPLPSKYEAASISSQIRSADQLDTTTQRAIVEGIQRTAGGKKQEKDLLGSMAHRLAVVEKELLQAKREIVEKDQYIQKLESRLATVSTDGREQLELRCVNLQKQVEEMEEFLNDYGMVWIGKDTTPPLTPEQKEVWFTPEQQGVGQGVWSPGDSVPKEESVNFDLIVKHVQELNSLCDQTQIKNTCQGATIKALDPVPLTLFQNGLVLFQGPFRPYTDPSTQQCVQDLTDGYFPSELQSRYPAGVPLQLTDCRDTIFRAREYADIFPGYGTPLGGEKGPSRLVASNRSSTPKYQSDIGPKVSLDKFLTQLPASVVRGGKVVDIRSSIAQTLQGDSGPEVQVVPTPVLEELKSRLDVEEDVRPPTPSHTTTLRVRTSDKTYVLKMRYSDTIATVREYIDKLRGGASNKYQLQSTFPTRTFTDTSQTLAQSGLVPSANLFIVNT